MKALTVFVAVSFCLLFAGAAQAQETPSVEVFGGYTFIHVNVGDVSGSVNPDSAARSAAIRRTSAPLFPGDPHVTSDVHGGSASAAFNLNKWFGLAADFGGSSISTIKASGFPDVSVDSTLFTYLFGPRFSYRNYERVTPFAQVLIGGAHITDVKSGGTVIANSENAFALSVGGGLDVKVSKHVAIRVAQVEYLMTKFDAPFALTGSSTQNNLRVSGGLVIRFGSK
jgi:opacity protein-like surface antigen